MAHTVLSGQPLISARGLRKAFGSVVALRGVDLDLYPGEFLTVFGPNGAGKTTLLRVLSTLTRPSAGSLAILGLSIPKGSEVVRNQIGVISHQALLYPNLTARENLEFYGALYGVPKLSGRITEILQEVELAGLDDRPLKTLSHGMVQRLAIARALLHGPRILLMDEPYTGLDQHAARLLRGLLAALHTPERGILMTTHNITRGLELCDRAAIQAGGRIVYQALAEEIDPLEFEELYFQYTARV